MMYIYDLCTHLMLSSEYADKDVDYQEGFVQFKVYDLPYEVAANLAYYPKDGEGNLIEKKKQNNKFYLYFCSIYEIVAHVFLGSDKCVFQTLRAKARSVVSATSERSRLQTSLA